VNPNVYHPSYGSRITSRSGTSVWDGRGYVSLQKFSEERKATPTKQVAPAQTSSPTPSTIVNLSSNAPTEPLTYANPSLVAATAVTGGPRAPSFGQPSPGQTAPSTPATAAQTQPGGPRAPSFGQPTPGQAGQGIPAASGSNGFVCAGGSIGIASVAGCTTTNGSSYVSVGFGASAPGLSVTAGSVVNGTADDHLSGFSCSANLGTGAGVSFSPSEKSTTAVTVGTPQAGCSFGVQVSGSDNSQANSNQGTTSSGGESSSGRSIADHQTGFGGGEGGAVSSGGESSAGRGIADHQTGFGGGEGGGGEGGGGEGGGGGDGGGGD